MATVEIIKEEPYSNPKKIRSTQEGDIFRIPTKFKYPEFNLMSYLDAYFLVNVNGEYKEFHPARMFLSCQIFDENNPNLNQRAHTEGTVNPIFEEKGLIEGLRFLQGKKIKILKQREIRTLSWHDNRIHTITFYDCDIVN